MIEKVRKLDSIELLPNDQYRFRFSQVYKDSETGKEEPARDPVYATLNPSNPGHAPAMNLARSLWKAVEKLGKVT
jgi:hypothetical protein